MMHTKNITSDLCAADAAPALLFQRNAVPPAFLRFTMAIARAYERGDGRRVDRLLAAKVRAVRRFHGVGADGGRGHGAESGR
jgi:hypothetical protein